MPIQKDNRLFPNLIPGPPEDEEQLLEWARNTSGALQDLSRQFIDKFNLHVVQTHAHPQSWKTSRVNRPAFRRHVSDNTQIILDADATNPAYFSIGSNLYESTADLTLDMDTAGVGGLRTGLTKTADTLYYLYAVFNEGAVSLIADTNGPATGVSGYSEWNYLGSFCSVASGNLDSFQFRDGIYMASINNANHEVSQAGTTITAKTLKVSAIAKWVYGRLNFSTAINAATDEIGLSTDSAAVLGRLRAGTTTVANSPLGFAWVPIITAQTIYMNTSNAGTTGVFRSLGWIEEPMEFK